MELDDMKNMWQQYDKALQDNKVLNEKIIRMMMKDKSGTQLNKILNFEYLNVTVCGMVLLGLLLHMGMLGSSMTMILAYSFAVLTTAGFLWFCIYKIKLLTKVDFGINTVTDAAQRVQQLRLLIVKERLSALILTPFYLGSLFIVFVKWIHRVDLMDNFHHMHMLLFVVLFASIISIGVSLYIYQRLYFNSFKSILSNLKEIEEFKMM